MIGVRVRTRNFVMAGITALMCVGALSACKTTDYRTEREVDISETHIVLPSALLKRDDFKIKKTVVISEGSWVMEKVYFNGGSYAYERYFRGRSDRASGAA